MNPSILLVDDETSVCSALCRTFKKNNFKVFQANSGKQALDLLKDNNIDVVLSDQLMPGMTGTELLSIVKNLYPDTSRIILSGHSGIKDLTDAINEANIYRFLPKPWDEKHLLNTVNSAIIKPSSNSLPSTLSLLNQNKEDRREIKAMAPSIEDAFIQKQIDLENSIKNNVMTLEEQHYSSRKECYEKLNYLNIAWPSFFRFKHEDIINIAKQSGYLHDLFTWYLLNTINRIEENDYSDKTLVIDLFSESFLNNQSLKKLLQTVRNQKSELIFRLSFDTLRNDYFTDFLMDIYSANISLLLNIDKRVIDITELESTPVQYIEMDGKQSSTNNRLLTEKRLKMLRDAQNLSIKTILSREPSPARYSYVKSLEFDFF